MKLKSRIKTQVMAVFFSMASLLSFAQSTGNFKGKILDQSTKQPVVGATVQIDHSQFGAITDTSGVFTVNNIPAGTYSVTISYIGFQTKNISEVVITPGKTYYSELEILEAVANLNEATVRAFKGENNLLTPVSTFSYSREEIFRNPGAQGDIMRALGSLPGVVSSGAQFSAIAARGQGTQDNVYMVDDMPMFNLSHLEAEGFNSGFNDPNGGRSSIFAPRIIDNVQFQNGGFDAVYGRKSSSYLGLGIKEGNKETWSFAGQFDLLGATLIADGPVSKKTSVFASGRYQNFALLQRVLDQPNPVSIGFGDYLIKTTTELNAKNKLSVVAMYNPERPSRSIDDIDSNYNINDDNSGGTMLFNHKGSKALVGLNLRTLIDSKSYTKNVLYFRTSRVDNNFGNFTPSLDEEGYVRITIDGLENEISLGKKVHPDDWCNQTKKVTASGMEAKLINIAIDQARTSLTSQLIVLQSQFECITPAMLKNIFKGKPVEDKCDAPKQVLNKQQTLLQAFNEHIENLN